MSELDPARHRGAPMRILLLCSAFNGLTQRAWIELREAGHDVSVELALDARRSSSAVALFEPDLIICPFLASGSRRGVDPVSDDHRAPGSQGRPGPVLVGLGDHRPASRSGASRRCRPSRRWTPARSGRRGRSRSARARRARAPSTTVPSPTRRSSSIREVVAKAGDPAFRRSRWTTRSRRDRAAPPGDAGGRPAVLLVRLAPTRSCVGSAPPTDRPVRARRCATAGGGVRRPPGTDRSRPRPARSCAATTTPCSCAPATAACGSARSEPKGR